jgi:hypothetical protein
LSETSNCFGHIQLAGKLSYADVISCTTGDVLGKDKSTFLSELINKEEGVEVGIDLMP